MHAIAGLCTHMFRCVKFPANSFHQLMMINHGAFPRQILSIELTMPKQG